MEIKEDVKTILNSSNLLPHLFSNILSSITIPRIVVIVIHKISVLLPVQRTVLS